MPDSPDPRLTGDARLALPLDGGGLDGTEAFAEYWVDQINTSQKQTERAAIQSRRAWRAYRNQAGSNRVHIHLQETVEEGIEGVMPVNLFFSNIESQKPLIYNQTPQVVVRHRPERSQNRAELLAAEMLRRCLVAMLDSPWFDCDAVMQRVRDDFLVGGRGMLEVAFHQGGGQERADPIPVEYDGKFWRTPTGETLDPALVAPLPDSGSGPGKRGTWRPPLSPDSPEPQVRLEYVPQDEVLLDASARRWEEVEWVATVEYTNPREIEARFGLEVARRAFYEDYTDRADASGEHAEFEDSAAYQHTEDDRKRARVWRIFDRQNRRVIWLNTPAPGDQAGLESAGMVLAIEPDVLGLPGFLPFPEPLTTCQSNDNLRPVPEYVQYEAILDQLQNVMRRYFHVVDAIRAKGFYDGASQGEIAKIFDDKSPEAKLYGITEMGATSTDMRQKVGWVPMGELASVATALSQNMMVLKDWSYEVSGISDVIRGSSQPRETATAQRIKSQFASGRIGEKKRLMARFFRNALRMAATIISKRFDPGTLMRVSGIRLRPLDEIEQEHTQLQQLAQAAPPPPAGAPPGPNPAEQMQAKLRQLEDEVSIEEVLAVLRSDRSRTFAIDIETDSTVAADQDTERQQRIELLQTLVQTMQAVGPLAQQGALPRDIVPKVFAMFLRGIPNATQLLDQLENHEMPPPPPPPPDPDIIKADSAERQLQQTQQHEKSERQKDREHEIELERLRATLTQEIEQLKSGLDLREEKTKSVLDMGEEQVRAALELRGEEVKAELDIEKEKVKSELDIEKEKAKGEVQVKVEKAKPKPAGPASSGSKKKN